MSDSGKLGIFLGYGSVLPQNKSKSYKEIVFDGEKKKYNG